MKTLRRARARAPGYRIFFCSLRIKEERLWPPPPPPPPLEGIALFCFSLSGAFRSANIFRVIPPLVQAPFFSGRTNTRSREKLQVRLLFFPTFNQPLAPPPPLSRPHWPALRFVLSAFLFNRFGPEAR